MRTCKDCGETKPVEAFSWMLNVRGERRGQDRRCKPCRAFFARLRTYGLTHEEYDALVAAQKGICAMCEAPATDIDHDHATGNVRALLCRRCNLLLGLAHDDPEMLQTAIDYLTRFS